MWHIYICMHTDKLKEHTKKNSLGTPIGYKTPPPPLSLPSLHGNPTMKESSHFCSKLKKASHSFSFPSIDIQKISSF